MYAIGTLFYGVDLTDTGINDNEAVWGAFENELPGTWSEYSGGGEKPYAFGVLLNVFDECGTVNVSSWIPHFAKEAEYREQYDKMFNELPKVVQDHIVAQPNGARFVIVWSTS